MREIHTLVPAERKPSGNMKLRTDLTSAELRAEYRRQREAKGPCRARWAIVQHAWQRDQPLWSILY